MSYRLASKIPKYRCVKRAKRSFEDVCYQAEPENERNDGCHPARDFSH
jgi:hypothetical protein